MATTNNTVAARLADISKYRFNPASIQSSALDLITAMRNGEIQFVDPSNPFIAMIENSTLNTVAWMTEDAVLSGQQYPAAAQTLEDLYRHMSDKDYVDRFAVPTTANFSIFYSYEELLQKLVADPNNPGVKKLVIPRNTYVTINDVVFSLQYPIEIRQMAHGGLQIVYNVDELSPLQTLTTNLIDFQFITDNSGNNLITFMVKMTQFKINSLSFPISQATGFVQRIQLDDQLYFARVYIDNGDTTFTEIQTTYSENVYDVSVPTANLKLLDGNVLQIKIPQIYLTTGLLTKKIRLDIYLTKGVLAMDFITFRPEQYVLTYKAYTPVEEDAYVAPMSTLQVNYVMSGDMVDGGANAMTFSELRTRVMKNAIGSPNLPITNVQIESALQRKNYTIVKNIDNITNRQFLATRPMPDPQAPELITAASAGMMLVATSIEDAVTIDTVVDNGDIVTIRPETLYKTTNGLVTMVPSAEIAAIELLTQDQKAIVVNTNNYLYTPFYYVLDSSNNQFNIRPYHLDTPIVESKSFIGENDTTLLQVGTSAYSVMRTDTGYVIEILTNSSDEWKNLDDSEVFVQLAYLPTGDVDRAYVTGTLMGKNSDGERIYHFPINTTWRIGADHELQLSSFQMYDQTARKLDIPLLNKFDLIFSTTTPKGPQWLMSEIDSVVGYFQLPAGAYAIAQESLNVRFGYYLKDLWARARSVVGENEYEFWAADVPAVYEKDVYRVNPATGSVFTITAEGDLEYDILHRAGDPILDASGNQVYRYRVGDVKLDAYGNPIIVKSRTLIRQMDFLLIEGTYYFASNQVTLDYRNYLRNTIVDRVITDLADIDKELLEQSDIFYYPTTNIGLVKVIFQNGLETYLEAGQTFRVTLFVSASVYNNYDLRAALTTNTIKTISDQLEQRIVSMSNIIDALRSTYKDDVISIDISGLGGNKNLNVVTIIDDAQRLSLRKLLIARNDETLGLQEGVEITFVQHERTDISV